MNHTFVIGDIHGAFEALKQCLGRARFSYEDDRLICLGDVCDRRPGVKECFDELLKIEKLVYILGNHDLWCLEWMQGRKEPGIWRSQGGDYTIQSYPKGVPESHIRLLENAVYYHEEGNRIFVHGGFNHKLPLNTQQSDIFLWDRTLVFTAYEKADTNIRLGNYDEIYVGHTPTLNFKSRANRVDEEQYNHLSDNYPNPDEKKTYHRNGFITKDQRNDIPLQLCNVWLMDTGAGWPDGRLSMMNVETKEVFQSDQLE